MSRRKGRINVCKPLWDDFSLSELQRAEVEAAFGNKLSPSAWAEVDYETCLFVGLMRGIKSAMPLKSIEKKLDKFAIYANSLSQEICGKPCPDSRGRSLQDIKRAFQNMSSNFSPEQLLNGINVISAISTFLNESMKNLGKGDLMSGLSPDKWWNIWIGYLTEIMWKHGLPYQARKDSDKHSGPPSPFVSFVFEIQKHMPVECRKYNHSVNALAQAIYRARRELYLGELMGASMGPDGWCLTVVRPSARS